MAYDPDMTNTRNLRDKAYPSQIAAERPIGATRIQCDDPQPPSSSLAGGTHPMHTESACDRFNRELRSGLGTGRSHDTDD